MNEWSKLTTKLTVAQVAKLASVNPKTWRAYVSRGQRPAADGHSDPCGCPFWYLKTIEPWIKA